MDDRELALNEEIARLEKEIAELKTRPAKPGRNRPVPSVQTARISGAVTPELSDTPPMVTNVVPTVVLETPVPPVPLPPAPFPGTMGTSGASAGDPRNKAPLKAGPNATAVPMVPNAAGTDPRYNELGERKFDVGVWWGNLTRQFRRERVGPANPEMVKYLASGSVQGLRPLRFERRIARNRTLGLVAILVVVLYGLAWVFFRR